MHYGDLSDGEQISNIIYNIKPDEIYHLGAQSHVRVSFDLAEYTGNITALGTTRILEAPKENQHNIFKDIKTLEKIVGKGSMNMLIEKLKEIVPDYRPSQQILGVLQRERLLL